MVIHSIGHSNRSIEVFVARLLVFEINRVVDVRTRPYSRFFPQYNKQQLEDTLEWYGIAYDFRGNNLGGLGENTKFEETIVELSSMSDRMNIALLCSEADYKKCHRHTILEPAFRKQGITMNHIVYP